MLDSGSNLGKWFDNPSTNGRFCLCQRRVRDGWVQYNGPESPRSDTNELHYKLFKPSTQPTWTQAKTFCEGISYLGRTAKLASLYNQDEYDFYKSDEFWDNFNEWNCCHWIWTGGEEYRINDWCWYSLTLWTENRSYMTDYSTFECHGNFSRHNL